MPHFNQDFNQGFNQAPHFASPLPALSHALPATIISQHNPPA
jgi:hypothetical protein